MWSEPLTPASADTGDYSFTAQVLDAGGAAVAHVDCVVNRQARTGWFGEMNIDDQAGGVRQRIRALVLLVRESLRHAAELGITDVRTEAPPRMATFAARLTGQPGQAFGGGRVHFRGRLADIRTRTLGESDADGNLSQR